MTPQDDKVAQDSERVNFLSLWWVIIVTEFSFCVFLEFWSGSFQWKRYRKLQNVHVHVVSWLLESWQGQIAGPTVVWLKGNLAKRSGVLYQKDGNTRHVTIHWIGTVYLSTGWQLSTLWTTKSKWQYLFALICIVQWSGWEQFSKELLLVAVVTDILTTWGWL